MKNLAINKLLIVGLMAIAILASCGDDDTDEPSGPDAGFLMSNIDALGEVNIGLTVPTVYPENLATTGPLAPAAYNGQVTRVEQLRQIRGVLRDQPITADLGDALRNGNNELFTGVAVSTTEIRTKIDELNFDNGDQSVADDFEVLADLLVSSSNDNTGTASDGTAGILGDRHFSARGLEYAQILEKGLYGPLLYNQLAADYLRPAQAGAQSTNNVTDAGDDYASEGTARQHAFDESFGYFAVNPATYPNLANTSNGDGEFISNYTFDFSDETEEAYGINLAQRVFDSYLFGRTVLKAGEGNTSLEETTNEELYNAARADVLLYTEAGIAAAAFHYLNLTLTDVDPADRLHHFSEALAFIYTLAWGAPGESRITSAQVFTVLDGLGWGSNDLEGVYDIDCWNVTNDQVEAARQALDTYFPGFADVPF
ncbi:MAG: DUF4856 domain-containing protein [Bacteroidota bacterium]